MVVYVVSAVLGELGWTSYGNCGNVSVDLLSYLLNEWWLYCCCWSPIRLTGKYSSFLSKCVRLVLFKPEAEWSLIFYNSRLLICKDVWAGGILYSKLDPVCLLLVQLLFIYNYSSLFRGSEFLGVECSNVAHQWVIVFNFFYLFLLIGIIWYSFENETVSSVYLEFYKILGDAF